MEIKKSPQIGGHPFSGSDFDQIANNQIPGRRVPFPAIANHASVLGQKTLEAANYLEAINM
jgi:hypothetical protein